MRESTTAIVARNETWTGVSATEPYEAGWAAELMVFVRALDDAGGPLPAARVQISPDGMRWVDEGTSLALPSVKDAVTFARVARFGNWVRVVADLPRGRALKVLITLHAKA